MGVQLIGNGGVVADVDGTTFRALKVASRPAEYGALGHFKLAMTTGAMAAALGAGSEIFQFRWAPAVTSQLCVVSKIHVDGWFASTAFTAGQALFAAYIARAWTADGSGGTAATLTGDNQQMRTSMGTSSAVARIASTGALTAGTKTLDAQSFGQINTHTSAGENAATPIIGNQHLPPIDALFDPDVADGEHPLVLANQEGFAIKATVPATGVWTIGVTVRWAEVTAY